MRTLVRRVSEVRRHPPEGMEESLPALRVVAAEIETPGQSPRGDLASPSSSGDSFGKALMHQAMRLKTAMLNQKVFLQTSLAGHAGTLSGIMLGLHPTMLCHAV